MTWQFYAAPVVLLIGFMVISQLRNRLGSEDIAAVRDALQKGARIVDVRTPAEFSAGHVPGAVNVPLADLPSRIKKVAKKRKPVVVYCRSGSRSSHAVTLLRGRGYHQVLDMKAMTNWQRVQAAAN